MSSQSSYHQSSAHRPKNFQTNHHQRNQGQFQRQPSQENSEPNNNSAPNHQQNIAFILPQSDKMNIRHGNPSQIRSFQPRNINPAAMGANPSQTQHFMMGPNALMSMGQPNLQNPIISGINGQLQGPVMLAGQPPLYQYFFDNPAGPSLSQGVPQNIAGVPRGPNPATFYNQQPNGSGGLSHNPHMMYNGTAVNRGPPSYSPAPFNITTSVAPPTSSYLTSGYQQPVSSNSSQFTSMPPQPAQLASSAPSVMTPGLGSGVQAVTQSQPPPSYQPPPKREKKILLIQDPNTQAVINQEDVEKNQRLQEEAQAYSETGSHGRTPSPGATSTVTPDLHVHDRLKAQPSGHTDSSLRTDVVGGTSSVGPSEDDGAKCSETEHTTVVTDPSVEKSAAVPPKLSAPSQAQLPDEGVVASPSTKIKRDFLDAVLDAVYKKPVAAEVGKVGLPESGISFGDFGGASDMDDSRGEDEPEPPAKEREPTSDKEQLAPSPKPAEKSEISRETPEKEKSPPEDEDQELEKKSELLVNWNAQEPTSESLPVPNVSEVDVPDSSCNSDRDVQDIEKVSGEAGLLVNGESTATEPSFAPTPDETQKAEEESSPETVETAVDPKSAEFFNVQEKVMEIDTAQSESEGQASCYDRNHLTLLRRLVELVDYTSEDLQVAKKNPDLREVCCEPGNRAPKEISGAPGPRNYDQKRSTSFMPSFMGQPPQGHRGPMPNRQSYHGRPSQENRRPMKQQTVIRPSIERETKLTHTAENAWKPGVKAGKDAKLSTDPIEMLQKKVRSILNKIAPTTFAELKAEFLIMEVNGEEQWVKVIDVIFDKAVEEPGFCQIYSSLCKAVVEKELSNPDSSGQKGRSLFRNLLLAKCQRFFSEDTKEQEASDELKKKIDTAEEKDKKALEEELYIKELKKKRRKLGNIRFIGELYKQDLLITKIMHYCVTQLFVEQDDESVESLCRLMTTVGKKLEESEKLSADPSGLQKCYLYYGKLEESAKNYSARIRFMIMDLLDLRKDNWVPRIATAGPKTKAEIHADVQNEKLQQEVKLQQFQQQEQQNRKMSFQGRQSQGGMRKGSTPNRPSWGANNDKRGQEKRKDPAAAQRAVQDLNIKETRNPGGLSKHLEADGALGRSGGWMTQGKTGRASWAGGATGGARGKASGGRDGSRGGESQGNSREPSETRLSKERQSALQACKAITGDQNRTPPPTTPEPEMELQAQSSRPQEDPEAASKLKRFAMALVDEAVVSTNLEEAVKVMEEKGTQVGGILNHCLFHCVEKKMEHRLMLGRIVDMAVDKNIFGKQVFIDSLCQMIEEAKDIELKDDVPKLYQYLGEISGKILAMSRRTNRFNLTDFAPAVLVSEYNGKDLLAHALLTVKNDIDGGIQRAKEVVSVYSPEKFGVKAQDLVSKSEFEELTELLKDHLKQPPSPELDQGQSSTGPGSVEVGAENVVDAPLDDVSLEIELDRKLRGDDPMTELMDSPIMNHPNILRAFTKTVFKVCIHGVDETSEFDDDALEKMHRVVMRVMDGNSENRKLLLDQANQACKDREYPKELLPSIFNVLAYNNLVSREDFEEWRSENEPLLGMVFMNPAMKRFYQDLVQPRSEDEADDQ